MTNTVNFVARYVWLFAIAVIIYADFVSKRRRSSQPIDPARYGEYSRLRLLISAAFVAPWLLMGYSILFGDVSSAWQYFRPQDHNTFVVAWFAYIFLLSCGLAFWAVLLGGAVKIVEFQLHEQIGFVGNSPPTVRRVKLYAASTPILIVIFVLFLIRLNVA